MRINGAQFSVPMVCAIRDRHKTQTRRLEGSPLLKLSAGDVLYVREAFTVSNIREFDDRVIVDVKTDAGAHFINYRWPEHCAAPRAKHYPGMHHQKAMARIALKVRSVRLELLQSITPDDAIAEGVMHPDLAAPANLDPVERFAWLWDSLHPAGKRWADNPLIGRIAFETETHMATVAALVKGQ